MPWTDPVDITGDGTAVLSNGDRTVTVQLLSAAGYDGELRGTLARNHSAGGKWYYEFSIALLNVTVSLPSSFENRAVGIFDTFGGATPEPSIDVSSQTGFASGDLIGVEVDLDAAECHFYRNGAFLETQAFADDPTAQWVPFVVISGPTGYTGPPPPAADDLIATGNFLEADLEETPSVGFTAWEESESEFVGFWTAKDGTTETA